jgi:hypothetical protein
MYYSEFHRGACHKLQRIFCDFVTYHGTTVRLTH